MGSRDYWFQAHLLRVVHRRHPVTSGLLLLIILSSTSPICPAPRVDRIAVSVGRDFIDSRHSHYVVRGTQKSLRGTLRPTQEVDSRDKVNNLSQHSGNRWSERWDPLDRKKPWIEAGKSRWLARSLQSGDCPLLNHHEGTAVTEDKYSHFTYRVPPQNRILHHRTGYYKNPTLARTVPLVRTDCHHPSSRHRHSIE